MMKFSILRENFNILALVFILIIFFLTRFYLIISHFGHGDDMGIGHIIWKFGNYDASEIKLKLAEYNKDFFILNYLIDIPYLFPIIKFILTPFAISENSSYAPLQFFLTSFFARFNDTYLISLFSIRVPSVLSSIASLTCFFLIYKKLDKKNFKTLTLSTYFILTLSWMFLIYSSLALNAANILLTFAILIFLLLQSNQQIISIKKSLLYGFIVSLLLLAHYQTLIFIPAFYFSLFFLEHFKIRNFFKKWFPSILICGLVVIVIYFHYLVRIKTIHWNAGYNSEFLLNYEYIFDHWKNSLQYIYIFFFKNFFFTLQSVFSFSDVNNWISKLYIFLLFFFSIYAIINFDKKNKILYSIFIFILSTFVFWIILVLFKKLTLSPTRHSMFLLGPITFLTSYGIMIFLQKFIKSYITRFILPIFLIFFLISYGLNFFSNSDQRKDPFQKVLYESILQKNKVSHIITYDFPPSQYYFPYINNSFLHKVGPENSIIYYHKNFLNKKDEKIFAFVGTRKTFSDIKTEKEYYSMMIDFINSKNFMNFDYKRKNNSPLFLSKFTKDIEFNIIYDYTFLSDTEVDFGNFTKNGSNNLVIKILKHNEKKPN